MKKTLQATAFLAAVIVMAGIAAALLEMFLLWIGGGDPARALLRVAAIYLVFAWGRKFLTS